MNKKILITMFSMMFIVLTLSTLNAGVVAFCASKFENVDIITKLQFPVDQEIGDIRLNVTGNIPLNLNFKAKLVEEIDGFAVGDSKIIRGQMSNGQASFDFDYTPTSTKKLIIQIEMCQDEGTSVDSCDESSLLLETKEIEIAKSFDLKLFCPIINTIGQEVTCNWEPTDVESGTAINVDIKSLKVTQGEEVLSSPIIGSSTAFTPSATGSVTVQIEASKEGYVKVSEEQIISVEAAETKQVFEIGGTEYNRITSQGIDVGTQSLTFVVNEGNQPTNVRSIDATITTPSGDKVPVTFNKRNDEWQATYNFNQAGQKYILKGQITFEDKEPIPFIYDISTISAQTESERSNMILLIISIAVVIFLIIGGIILFIVLRK